MQEVEVYEASKDGIFYELHSIYQTFKQLDTPKEQVVFNLNKIQNINPPLAIALSSHIKETGSIFIEPTNKKLLEYLKKIQFPAGLTPLDKTYALGESYTPITFIKRTQDIREKEQMLFHFLDLILQFVNQNKNLKNSLYYPIVELINNIFEHSKKNIGCIFAKKFEKQDFIEICIADTGRGIRQSYKDDLSLDLTDDLAIAESMSGHSTKSSDRGFGLRTSKRVICEGYGGEFMVLSGSAAYAVSGNDEILDVLPDFNWNGVLIFYRLPQPNQIVDLSKYWE